jgi:hypothetical protein
VTHDETGIRALLGPADPARGAHVPPPPVSARQLIALTGDRKAPRNGRRILLAAGALAAVSAVAGSAYGLRDGQPKQPNQPQEPQANDTGFRLGPIVRPLALQFSGNPPGARAKLRELADRIVAAGFDGASGQYTYIHTISWNAVFDDAPGGKAQMISPQDTERWYAPGKNGRIHQVSLPPVYPNEESKKYWESKPKPKTTGTAPAKVNDLGPGMAGPDEPLTSDPAELVGSLGVDDGTAHVFSRIGEVSTYFLVPLAARAQIFRILSGLSGVVWRGTVTDRAGRGGVAVSTDDDDGVRQLLVFDPVTGVFLAWDTVEHPDTVAGSSLLMSCERRDRIG